MSCAANSRDSKATTDAATALTHTNVEFPCSTLAFVDETASFFHPGKPRTLLEGFRGISSDQMPGTFQAVNTSSLETLVRTHVLVANAHEGERAWQAVLEATYNHALLVSLFQAKRYDKVDEILSPLISQTLYLYRRHLKFWTNYFTADFRARVANHLQNDRFFLATSIASFDLDKQGDSMGALFSEC